MVACGERKLIHFEKGKSCLCATSNSFWKEPKSHYCMETRKSRKKKWLTAP